MLLKNCASNSTIRIRDVRYKDKLYTVGNKEALPKISGLNGVIKDGMANVELTEKGEKDAVWFCGDTDVDCLILTEAERAAVGQAAPQ